ncbi:MAG: hypothetical protein ACLTYN_14805 [Dysosmobacter welbionis]
MKLARRLSRQHRFVLEGEMYKRPRGRPPALSLVQPEKHRPDLGPQLRGLLFTPELAGEAESFRFLKPYYDLSLPPWR